MKERQIESEVCEYAKSKGCLVYKFNSEACRGVPDRMILFVGNTLFIEFKHPKGTTSKLQEIQRRKLQEHGFFCVTIDAVLKGKMLIDAFIEVIQEDAEC